jgi:histidinol-phosphatase (PHP family)
MDGRFCLSDDSHGTAQVGAKYHEMLSFMQNHGIKQLHYLELAPEGTFSGIDPRFPQTIQKAVTLKDVEKMPYWQR